MFTIRIENGRVAPLKPIILNVDNIFRIKKIYHISSIQVLKRVLEVDYI